MHQFRCRNCLKLGLMFAEENTEYKVFIKMKNYVQFPTKKRANGLDEKILTVHTSNKETQTVEALGLTWLTEGQSLHLTGLVHKE